MKILEKVQINKINLMSFKTLMVITFIYPILPLGLLATFMIIFGGGSLLSTGLKYSSISQVIYQFLLFSGGLSGLIGGIMVLKNRINTTSLLLFLHGAVSYSFVAFVILLYGTNLKSLWVLHSFYVAITLVVVVFQLYLIMRQVFAGLKEAKVVN